MRYVIREDKRELKDIPFTISTTPERARFLVVDTEKLNQAGSMVYACEKREDAQKVLDMLIKHPAVADRIASGKSRITGVA